MKPKAWDDDFDKEFYTDDEIKASDDRAKQITDRLKREKVIKGLECCAEDMCEVCPYAELCYSDGIPLCSPMAKDALELLKVQEPRVMTLEELEDWDGAIFFEAYETDMYYALIDDVNLMAGIKGQYSFVNVEPGQWNAHIWGGEHYGSIWRCWTSRPTDAQREATQWKA